MANPIYAEVVPRELSYATQARLVQEVAWYVRPDGDLDVEKLMGAFQTFFLGSTRSTGWGGSTIRRRGRSFCCRRSCSGS